MNTPCKQIQIIIADDHPLIRKSLKIVINENVRFKLVGEAANGKELIDLAIKLKPDIIITDIKMPVMDGIEATKYLIKKLPSTGIIALSVIDNGRLIVDMLEAGAKGYLSKDVFADELAEAVNTVYQNKNYYSNTIKTHVTDLVAKGDYTVYKNVKEQFTEQERSIIKLICEEYSTKEIAEKLKTTKRSVDFIRDKILKKMAVKNIAGIVRYAIEHGLYEPAHTNNL